MRALRICQVGTGHLPIPPEGAGAVERVIFFLSRAMGKAGHIVKIIDIDEGRKRPILRNVVYEPVSTVHMKSKGFGLVIRGIMFMLSSIWRVSSVSKDTDIIHAHSQFGGFLSAIINRLFWRKPFIYTTHNQDIFDGNMLLRIANYAEVITMRMADRVICVSPTVKTKLIESYGFPSGKLIQVYNGIDFKSCKANGKKTKRFTILTVARISRRKNQMMILSSAKEIISYVPQAYFRFVGSCDDPGYLHELKDFAAREGLLEHLEFAGDLSNSGLEQAYCAADIFALTSVNENQGLSLIEAMTRKVPAICSDIGPFRDMVSLLPGSAILVKDAGELAETVKMLYLNPQERVRLGELGYELSLKFSWNSIAEMHLKIYRGCLA